MVYSAATEIRPPERWAQIAKNVNPLSGGRISVSSTVEVHCKYMFAPSLTQTSQQRGIFGLRSAGFETTGLKLKVELVLAQSRAAVSSEQSCC